MIDKKFEGHEDSPSYRRMPDHRPRVVSRLALSRTTTQVRTDEGQKTVRYSTLPKEAVILEVDERTHLFMNSNNANQLLSDLVVSEGDDQKVVMRVVCMVQPGEEDDKDTREELVVIQGERKSIQTEGIEGTIEGEADIVERFVRTHPDQFPSNGETN